MRALIDSLPNLITILAIVVVIRLLARLFTSIFAAVEQGRLMLPGVYPDTATPTRRIVVALLWLCALIVCYPYLPGSQSEMFKGVGVFVGLMVSLGSSGLMNQAMSGLMVTYSRSLECGEFVRIGTMEGTVTSVGALATKIISPFNEEITIPNATVASQATTNFSRKAVEGTYSATSVTIGYDTPWRQVHALLLIAAQRTPGVRRRAGAGHPADRPPGLVRAIHAVRRARAACPPVLRSRRAARQHPGRVQRTRRADHVAAICHGSTGAEGRSAGSLVHGPGVS